MAELKEKLFSEFAPVSTEEWMAKITADLKGVPFEKKLVWKTGEGFNVNPFYRAWCGRFHPRRCSRTPKACRCNRRI